MLKFYKLMFLNSLIIGSLITMSSYSWFFMWLGMEINLLSFIPLIYKPNCNYSSESSMKYFMIQALASTLLLFSIINLEISQKIYFLNINPFHFFLYMALMMKLGLAPVHSWFPEVSEGLNWSTLSLMLTWQKLAPMSIFMMLLMNKLFIMMIIILSSIISGFLGMNQISTRKILAYSSINHMSWMMFSMFWSFKIWLIYFIIYSISNIFLISYMCNLNLNKMNQINNFNLPLTLKIIFFLNFLSLSGFPPMIGFFPKWMTIYMNTIMGIEIMSIILILTTLFSIYFYIRFIIPILFLKTNKLNFKIKIKNNNTLISMNFLFLFCLPLLNSLW